MKLRTTLWIVLATLFFVTAQPGLAAEPASTLSGWLSIVWGDSHSEDAPEVHRKILLTTDDGQSTELTMSDELLQSSVYRWNGRRVLVHLADAAIDAKADATTPVSSSALRVVAAVQLLGDDDAPLGGGVFGSQPWVSILCKFADIADEPEDLAFFQGMYANSPAGLDHYWREVSADNIDVVGSLAIDWVNLPGTQTSYISTPGSGTTANLNLLFDDCTDAADPFVDFSNGGSPYAGINMMYNGLLDCCAWGGGRFATLDGTSKTWRTTWDPPWAFGDEGVIAHEMGHGFGLPHANNWDGDTNPYDSPWDVMSAATSYSVNDPTYGRLGKHVNAYHKDQLGWFPAERRFEAPDDSINTINLDHTALAGSTNYQIATIQIPGSSRWYTVESRIRSGDYEAGLPGDCVIIHEVDQGRSQPAWAYDSDVPPANFGDNEGTMWRVGETFNDAANSIAISIDSMTATGFVITIITGEAEFLFQDGFESGNTSMWVVAP